MRDISMIDEAVERGFIVSVRMVSANGASVRAIGKLTKTCNEYSMNTLKALVAFTAEDVVELCAGSSGHPWKLLIRIE